VPRHLQHVVSKRRAWRGDVCVVWVTAANWVLSVEKRNGLLTFWRHPLLPHFPTIVVGYLLSSSLLRTVATACVATDRLRGTSGRYR
jgi:hypothetical protein